MPARTSIAFISIVSLLASVFAAIPATSALAAGNVITNPSLETGTGNIAANWTQGNAFVGTGSTTITTTPTDVHSGLRAAQAVITAWTSGDLKWLPDTTTTSPGKYYTFSDWYKSSTSTQIGYFANGGTFHWVQDIGPAANWTQYTRGILVPAGVTSIQMAHILFHVGTLVTDDYSLVEQPAPVFPHGIVTLSFDDGWKSIYDNAIPILDPHVINAASSTPSIKTTQYIYTQAVLQGFSDSMTVQNIKNLRAAGHEIGAHTQQHVDLVNDNPTAFGYVDRPAMWAGEIGGSKSLLEGASMLNAPGSVTTFAYPYGSYNSDVEQAVSAATFIGARSVVDDFNLTATDKYALAQKHITVTTTAAEINGWIDQAIVNHTWLILMFHRVEKNTGTTTCADPVNQNVTDSDCTTTDVLQGVANHLVQVMPGNPGLIQTVAQGIAIMNANPPPDTVPPTITVPASPLNMVATSSLSTGAVVTFTASATDANPANPVVTCTPPSGSTFSLGSTTVTCTAHDAANNFATSTFVVHVTTPAPANVAPTANAQTVTVGPNTPVTITLTATDPDSSVLSFATTSNPIHGTLSGTGAVLTYTPSLNYGGSDSFNFTANDGTSTSAVATVSITVTSTPAPVLGNEQNAGSSATTVSLRWMTDHPATSRVVWDTVSHSNASSTQAGPANYGYANSTTEDTSLVTDHLVTVTGLTAATTYYVRPVSHGSPEAFGGEVAITTTVTPDPGPAPSSGSGGGGGGGGGGTVLGLIGTVNTNGGQVLGASTQALTDQQIAAIIALLQSFGADQSVIDSVNKALHGQATSGNSAPTSGFKFTKTLQVGSTGIEVTELQKRLTSQGLYSGPITAYFGQLTKAAVIKYQIKYALKPAVGVVGPKTRAKLNQ